MQASFRGWVWQVEICWMSGFGIGALSKVGFGWWHGDDARELWMVDEVELCCKAGLRWWLQC